VKCTFSSFESCSCLNGFWSVNKKAVKSVYKKWYYNSVIETQATPMINFTDRQLGLTNQPSSVFHGISYDALLDYKSKPYTFVEHTENLTCMNDLSVRVVLIECAWRNWRNILAHEFLAPIHVVFLRSYRSALWRKGKLAHR
jgi:hypothetical protein